MSPTHGNFRREICGAERGTTNNRMELTAAIKGLQALKRPCRVVLTTDSQYLSEAFQAGWLEKWKRNGWRTFNRKPVQNADLWQELVRLAEIHRIDWEWVRGHSNHTENERADELAVRARLELQRKGHSDQPG
ncbi:MAG: ribonuclease HI [Sandaracinaceae bacterium]|nr:ribonuclease HI [Sandaracinaceae bacterium]